MPDRRQNRGPHPEDAELFAPTWLAILRVASAEYSWLSSRGYSEVSALKLVGDRHRLAQRQRVAVARCSCSDEARNRRALRRLSQADLSGGKLVIDGFNVLITVEAALGAGVVLSARDNCYRDLASMHGTYRRASQTQTALMLLGQTVLELGVAECQLLLDSPVSNSGRLAQQMRDLAGERGWPWTVELLPNPDAALAASASPIASADSVVLDRCGTWFNLARLVVERHVAKAWVVDLSDAS